MLTLTLKSCCLIMGQSSKISYKIDAQIKRHVNMPQCTTLLTSKREPYNLYASAQKLYHAFRSTIISKD